LTCKLRRMVKPLPVWKKVGTADLDSRERSITFGSIEVREYKRILSVVAYPNVVNGLAIGWEYKQDEPVPVDDYKSADKPAPKPSKPNRCVQVLMNLSSSSTSKSRRRLRNCLESKTTQERLHILKNFGYSKQELSLVENERLQKQRLLSPKKVKPEGLQHWKSRCLVSSVRPRPAHQ
jgi:hypothetical protein